MDSSLGICINILLSTNLVSYLTDGKKTNMMGPCYENGFFSSPLSELLSQKSESQ